MSEQKTVLTVSTTKEGYVPMGGCHVQRDLAKIMSVDGVMAETYVNLVTLIIEGPPMINKQQRQRFTETCLACYISCAQQRIKEIITNGEYTAQAQPCILEQRSPMLALEKLIMEALSR
jgi:hypothetical protein